MAEFDAGKLANARSFGDENYYFLVAGEDPEGKTFSFVTRGKGKQNAATRIPIRLRLHADRDVEYIRQLPLEPILSILYDMEYRLEDLELLYVVMPRYGNIVSGLEADAPGGTANIGETREQVAEREFNEEADLTVLAVLSPFPSWLQFSSGSYDEVQNISFALVAGNPTKLVEGAIGWGSVPLHEFQEWVKGRNDPSTYLSDTTKFVPLDGKVVLATMWFIEHLKNIWEL